MLKCPKCNQIMDQTNGNKCPSCGFANKNATKLRFRVLTIILVLIAAGLTSLYFLVPAKLANLVYHFTNKPTDTTQSVSVQRDSAVDMYQAFMENYRVRPDERFIKAFAITVDLYQKYRSDTTDEINIDIGKIVHRKDMISIPLVKAGNVIHHFRLPAAMTFAEAMDALGNCLNALDQTPQKAFKNPPRGTYWMDQYNFANKRFYMIDPRRIIEGLMELDKLWQSGGPDSRIILAAAKGYALLQMCLYPDHMQYTDELAAYALGYLSLARHIDPELTGSREEAFVAMNMGYTAHADSILGKTQRTSGEPGDQLIDAYMRKDFDSLTKLAGKGSRVLGYYFLARLYRESGLYREATTEATSLLKRFSDHYPSIVEMIYSADLGIAKKLTVLYPLDILARLEHRVTPEALKDREAWIDRMKVFAGEVSTESNISLSKFENLLGVWQPLNDTDGYGYFIDEARLKAVYRGLYASAAYLRFNLLLKRWNQLEKTRNYVTALSGDDTNQPLVLAMSAEVNAKLGRRNEAKSICRRIITHPDTRAPLAMKAYFCLNDPEHKLKLAPGIAPKLDGRPLNRTRMGYLFQWINNYDMAASFYTLALKSDPYCFSNYQKLAHVIGSHEPVQSALIRYADNFAFLEKIGDYFANQNSLELKVNALRYYDKALDLMPARDSLWRQKAKVLSDLKRYEESAAVLREWIDTYGRNDLNTTIFKAGLARRYLDMGKPQVALEVLADRAESYQGGVMMVLARAYEETGQIQRAQEMYHKALKRYPTTNHILAGMAAFNWRNNRDEEAAAYIAEGRKLNGQFSRWYFEDFTDAFAKSTEHRIMAAVDHLIATGAGSWEINALAFRLDNQGRPMLAYKIMSKAPAGGKMQSLEKSVNIYKILRKWKGEDLAISILAPHFSPQVSGAMAMVLFKEGLFRPILSEIKNPDDYAASHREFMWLLKLMAWQACDRPESYAALFAKHYKRKSPDHYHAIGKFMLGILSRSDLLQMVKTPKQRCEFAYYIGFSERMKGNFPEATNWYHICLETGLSRNGEYHWALDELFWWAHMGTKNRHKKVSDDMNAYHENMSFK